MRRTALAVPVVLVTILVSACARPGPEVEPLIWSSSGEPVVVASLQVGGGFVPYAWHLMEGPRVVVYSDGRAVADSRRVLSLASDELSDLVRELRRDLSGLGPTVDAGGEMQVADAPTTTLRVRGGDGGLTSVSAYALGISRGYPARLVAARDRLENLARRTLDTGTAHTTDRLRLLLDPRSEVQDTVAAWPAGVPMPPLAPGAGFEVRTADFTGAAAEAASMLPGQTWESGRWPLVRAPDGALYAIAWRYVGPEE